MKDKNFTGFKNSIVSGNENFNDSDWIIKSMLQKFDDEDRTKLYKKHFGKKPNIRKNILAAALAGAMLLGTSVAISQSIKDENEFRNTPAQAEIINPEDPSMQNPNINPPYNTIYTPTLPEYAKNFNNPIYTTTWADGKEYWVCSEEFALELSRRALENVENMLQGCGSMGEKNGPFYADFFDEYFIAGNAYAESTLRICQTNGDQMKSKDNAIGMTQILPGTLTTLNNWLTNTMGIHDVKYTEADLNNPEKAVEISTLYYYYICKNYCRDVCNNSVYKLMGIEFSKSRQQELCTAIYNNGIGNIQTYIKNGTIDDYLFNGSPNNHANRVKRATDSFREDYQLNENT